MIILRKNKYDCTKERSSVLSCRLNTLRTLTGLKSLVKMYLKTIQSKRSSELNKLSMDIKIIKLMIYFHNYADDSSAIDFCILYFDNFY